MTKKNNSTNFGGNKVTILEKLASEPVVFSESPYFYGYFCIKEGQELAISHLTSYSIFALHTSGLTILSSGKSLELLSGDVATISKDSCTLQSPSAPSQVLVVGTSLTSTPPSCSLVRSADIKKVQKPWGHELWITGEHSEYVLKQIFIKAPYKTSLQFHHFKQETNVLFNGSAILHYAEVSDGSADGASMGAINQVELHPVSSIDISPPTIHRLEAVTDLLLYEASTPHLDDVVRISDDTFRPHGRVASEHV